MSNQIQRNMIVPIEFVEAEFFWRWERGSGVRATLLGEESGISLVKVGWESNVLKITQNNGTTILEQ
jgi:hypothetical protein